MESLGTQLRVRFVMHVLFPMLPGFRSPSYAIDGVADAQATRKRFHTIRILEGYHGVTSESSHSEMDSHGSQLRVRFVTHALFPRLPCFRSPSHAIDGVADAQASRKRFHTICTLEGYHGVTSESSHSEMQSLGTQLRVRFDTHVCTISNQCYPVSGYLLM